MLWGEGEAKLTFCRNGRFRPQLAWICCDYADLLLQRNGEGDRTKAMSLLDESLAISRELGMRPRQDFTGDLSGLLVPLPLNCDGLTRFDDLSLLPI